MRLKKLEKEAAAQRKKSEEAERVRQSMKQAEERRAKQAQEKADKEERAKAAELELINKKIELQRRVALRLMQTDLARGFASLVEMWQSSKVLRKVAVRLTQGELARGFFSWKEHWLLAVEERTAAPAPAPAPVPAASSAAMPAREAAAVAAAVAAAAPTQSAEKNREAAATKVQARARGAKVRKSKSSAAASTASMPPTNVPTSHAEAANWAAEEKAEGADEVALAAKVRAAPPTPAAEERREAAATKVQARTRGAQTRKNIRSKPIAAPAAATPPTVAPTSQDEAAATMIQARARGARTRKGHTVKQSKPRGGASAKPAAKAEEGAPLQPQLLEKVSTFEHLPTAKANVVPLPRPVPVTMSPAPPFAPLPAPSPAPPFAPLPAPPPAPPPALLLMPPYAPLSAPPASARPAAPLPPMPLNRVPLAPLSARTIYDLEAASGTVYYGRPAESFAPPTASPPPMPLSFVNAVQEAPTPLLALVARQRSRWQQQLEADLSPHISPHGESNLPYYATRPKRLARMYAAQPRRFDNTDREAALMGAYANNASLFGFDDGHDATPRTKQSKVLRAVYDKQGESVTRSPRRGRDPNAMMLPALPKVRGAGSSPWSSPRARRVEWR